jgi:hypothetical protein
MPPDASQPDEGVTEVCRKSSDFQHCRCQVGSNSLPQAAAASSMETATPTQLGRVEDAVDSRRWAGWVTPILGLAILRCPGACTWQAGDGTLGGTAQAACAFRLRSSGTIFSEHPLPTRAEQTSAQFRQWK